MHERKELYDVGSMHDRMTGVAYAGGLHQGLDAGVAGLAEVALDVSMKLAVIV